MSSSTLSASKSHNLCVSVSVCVLGLRLCKCRPLARAFREGGGGAYLKNRDQIISVGMIGHASSKDTRVLGGSGGMLPGKNFEI